MTHSSETAPRGERPAGAPAAVEVVDVDPGDLGALARFSVMPATGFFQPLPTPAELENRSRRVRGHRLRAGSVGGRWVGSLRSFDTELTLPGARVVPANAVSAVAVLPTHRRRGVLTALLRADLAAARERGEALSVLIASEAPIYGRFGFGAATEGTSWEVDPGRVRFRDDAPADEGSLELVDPREARAQLQAVHEGARRARAGGLLRDERWWDVGTGVLPGPETWDGTHRTVLRRGPDGAPDGYCRWTVAGSHTGRVSTATLEVHDLTALTPAAHRALWELVTSVDLVGRVRADDRPVDETLPWLLRDPRAAQRASQDDFLWVRVLDPAAALVARGYEAPGRLVLRVHDPGGPAAGTLLLESDGAGAHVVPSGAEPDVELGVDALGSLLLGGVPATLLARTGRLRARDAAALLRATVLFRTAEAPWCATWF